MSELSNLLHIKNLESVSTQLEQFIKSQLKTHFKKKGIVIGLSGGIDSSVNASICVKSIGSENVLGILLPEKESSPQSTKLANNLAHFLGIKTEIFDITQILDSCGVYSTRENIVKKYFNNFNDKCIYRLAVPKNSVIEGGLRIPFLEVQDEHKKIHQFKVLPSDFSILWSATSIKHRIRMTILYFFAEKTNSIVVGSTNKSEYIQGYFVKYGDGGVDIEPLLKLYKTQIYQLATFLKIPNEIIQRKASPDTWSFEVSDEDFFYGTSYKTLDLVWYAHQNNIPLNNLEKDTNLTKNQLINLISYLEQKWKSTNHMRQMPPSCEIIE